jgi:hypothetical protein
MNTPFDTWRPGTKVLSTLVAVLGLATMLGLAACLPTQQGGQDGDSDSSADADSDDDGSGDGDDSGGTGGAAADQGESCNEVLTCLVACADDTCQSACYAAGSDAARQKIDALVSCLNDSMCADDACAQAACGAQIDACVQDARVPDSGPPDVQGAVPAELVGDWLSSRGSYHFDESGSYWFVGVLSSDGPCIAFEKIVFTDTGVASAAGNELTLSAQTAQKATHDCGGEITTEATAAHTDQYTWSIDGTTLTLVNEAGAIEYAKQ